MRLKLDLAVLALTLTAVLPAESATASTSAQAGSPRTSAIAASPTIQVYGSNSPLGSAFTVTISATDGTQSQAVPVELVRASNTVLNFARFAFAGTIQVTVRVPNVATYSVSPRRYAIATQVDAATQTIRFTLTNDVASAYYHPMGGSIRLVVHDHYGTTAKLFLFADRQSTAPVPDGVSVFDATVDFAVSPGAADNTAAILRFDGVHNAHVRGPGVINANAWSTTDDKIVCMDAASSCSLEDATLTGAESRARFGDDRLRGGD